MPAEAGAALTEANVFVSIFKFAVESAPVIEPALAPAGASVVVVVTAMPVRTVVVMSIVMSHTI
jgi:hypothetical protein